MGSGLGIVLAFFAAYFAFIAGHNIAVLWLLAVLSFAFAGYRVWVKERKAFLALKNEMPRMKGRFHQVYFSPLLVGSLEHDGIEGYVVIQVSLGNVGTLRTSIHEFKLRITTDTGTFDGREVSGDGLGYLRSGGDPVRETYPLEVWKINKNPLGEGYSRGHLEQERWLRFSFVGLPANLAEEGAFESNVRSMTLLATDIDETTHEIPGGFPVNNQGSIVECPNVKVY
jgi:hypothetical protein